MRSLFLGGPRHGQWETTPGDRIIEIPVWETEKVPPFAHQQLVEPPTITRFMYRRVRLKTEEESLLIYVPFAVDVNQPGPFITQELLRIAWDAAGEKK